MLSVRTTVLVVLVAVSSFSLCVTASAGTIFTEDFNSLAVNDNDKQYDTGLRLGAGVDLPGWTRSGWAACHVVEISSGNEAIMLWGRNGEGENALNMVTLNTGIAANASGTTYKVAFDAGPGVYRDGNQSTETGDKFVIELLNSLDSVVATKTVSPDAWAGSETLKAYSFTYAGDGTGDVRVRIRALPSVDTTAWNFVGAVDNLSISSIPEPATGAITMSAAMVALLAYAWRKRK